MGSNLIPPKVDVILHLQKGKLCFEKLRGYTPAVAIPEEQYPYLPISQDSDTLIFRQDRASYIRDLLLQGKSRAETVTLVVDEYGRRRDTIGKAVDRERQKLQEQE